MIGKMGLATYQHEPRCALGIAPGLVRVFVPGAPGYVDTAGYWSDPDARFVLGELDKAESALVEQVQAVRGLWCQVENQRMTAQQLQGAAARLPNPTNVQASVQAGGTLRQLERELGEASRALELRCAEHRRAPSKPSKGTPSEPSKSTPSEPV